MLVTGSTANRADKQHVVHQPEYGATVCTWGDSSSGSLCRSSTIGLPALTREQISAWQKAMASLSSVPTTTDAAAWRELQWEHAATQASGCSMGSAVTLVQVSGCEQPCGMCTQVEEQLVTDLWQEVKGWEASRMWEGDLPLESPPTFPERGPTGRWDT